MRTLNWAEESACQEGILLVLAQLCAIQLWTRMPLQIYQPDPVAQEALLFLGRHEYLGTLGRLSPLCFGVLAALTVLDRGCMRHMLRCFPALMLMCALPAFQCSPLLSVQRAERTVQRSASSKGVEHDCSGNQLSCRQRARYAALWLGLIALNVAGCFVNKIGAQRDSAHTLANPIILAFAYIGITGEPWLIPEVAWQEVARQELSAEVHVKIDTSHAAVLVPCEDQIAAKKPWLGVHNACLARSM